MLAKKGFPRIIQSDRYEGWVGSVKVEGGKQEVVLSRESRNGPTGRDSVAALLVPKACEDLALYWVLQQFLSGRPGESRLGTPAWLERASFYRGV